MIDRDPTPRSNCLPTLYPLRRVCGQRLYDEEGNHIATCIYPAGYEHDHSDKTPEQAIAYGCAEAVPGMK